MLLLLFIYVALDILEKTCVSRVQILESLLPHRDWSVLYDRCVRVWYWHIFGGEGVIHCVGITRHQGVPFKVCSGTSIPHRKCIGQVVIFIMTS